MAASISSAPQAGDIARTCWLAAGLPDHVPGTTVDRQCGSSQQAVHFAAQAVMSGTQDLVVAGGVQTMNQIPIGAAMLAGQAYGQPDPFSGSRGWRERYGDPGSLAVPRGGDDRREVGHFSRREMEEFALESNRRALDGASTRGASTREIAPLNGLSADETPRVGTTLEKMAQLQPLAPGGRITAAVSSQIADGAAALLIASGGRRAPLRPEAARAHPSPVGARRRPGVDADRADPGDPARAGQGGHDARRHRSGRDQRGVRLGRARLAARAQCGPGDASTSTAARSRSAIRWGPPVRKLMTTLLHELERRGGRYGLQTMCEGGGQANVTIIERL